MFNILNPDTWPEASDLAFAWKENTFFDKEGEEKTNVPEKAMVILLAQIREEIEKRVSSTALEQYGGWERIIAEFLDGLVEHIPNRVNLENITQKIRNASKAFDILDLDSWDSASPDKPLIWNGETVPNAQHIPIKEREAVEAFQSIFAFLERKGDKLSTEKKLAAINKMFKMAVTPVTAQKGIFDPRKTTSYQDNILDIMLAKTHAQGAAWHRAMEQAQDEFRKEGITDLSYQNKDLIL